MVGLHVGRVKFLPPGTGGSCREGSTFPAELPPIMSGFDKEGPVKTGPSIWI